MLIDQENLMELWQDQHPEPNIDISYVSFHARVVHLPANTEFSSSS